jgi:hypothetical protein
MARHFLLALCTVITVSVACVSQSNEQDWSVAFVRMFSTWLEMGHMKGLNRTIGCCYFYSVSTRTSGFIRLKANGTRNAT